MTMKVVASDYDDAMYKLSGALDKTGQAFANLLQQDHLHKQLLGIPSYPYWEKKQVFKVDYAALRRVWDGA